MVKLKKKTKVIEDMDVDEFMSKGISDASDEEEPELDSPNTSQTFEDLKANIDDKLSKGAKANGKVVGHKLTLDKLKSKDPEFYEFLKQNDAELLNFDESDEEMADEKSDISFSDDETPKKRKKPKSHVIPDKLEVASDQSDDEPAPTGTEPIADESGKKLVTLNVVKRWEKSCKMKPSVLLLKQIVNGFRAAVELAGAEVKSARYRVNDSAAFNAVVRLCFTNVPSVMKKILEVKTTKKRKRFIHTASPLWKRVKPILKTYLGDLLKLIAEMQSADVVSISVKHLMQLVMYFPDFPKLSKPLLSQLCAIWSSSEESCRVLAFMTLLRVVRSMKESLLETAIKKMYISYVRNCKVVTPTTWPVINFMQRSFAEICGLDQALTYKHAFVYIRQMAIHLRNATMSKKQEMVQTVHNWQYILCLYLWGRVLSIQYPSAALEPLIYPLIMVTIGTAKLINTAKFYPLRFHCIKVLSIIGSATKRFIPMANLIIEPLEITDFNNKNSQLSLQPLNFDCLIKLSKSQLKENSFKEATVGLIVESLMEFFHLHAASGGFPELTYLVIHRLKGFLKNCKVGKYTSEIRTLIARLTAHNDYVEEERVKAIPNLKDTKAIDAFESRNIDETPFGKYYSSWRKLRDREIQTKISGKDQINDVIDIQKVPRANQMDPAKKEKLEAKRKASAGKSLAEILEESDSGDEIDDFSRFLPPDQRAKRPDAIQFSSDDDSDGGSSDSGDSDDDSDESDERESRKKKKLPAKKILKETVEKKQKRKKKKAKTGEAGVDVVEDLVLSD